MQGGVLPMPRGLPHGQHGPPGEGGEHGPCAGPQPLDKNPTAGATPSKLGDGPGVLNGPQPRIGVAPEEQLLRHPRRVTDGPLSKWKEIPVHFMSHRRSVLVEQQSDGPILHSWYSDTYRSDFTHFEFEGLFAPFAYFLVLFPARLSESASGPSRTFFFFDITGT